MSKELQYIDLGLPSGNLWATENSAAGSVTLFDWYAAKKAFFNGLPKYEDFAELNYECTHRYDNEKSGLVFTGPNGNELFFPCNEMIVKLPDGRNLPIEHYSRYWTATEYNRFNAVALIVQPEMYACYFPYGKEDQYNVRLIRRNR